MAGMLMNKVAVITGAASGIGLATAERFVSEGARVVLADVQEDAGRAASERLGNATRFVLTDVTDEAAIEAVVAAAVEHFGQLDIMVNNAAAQVNVLPIMEMGAEDFDAVLRLVTRSVVLGHKYAARQFQLQGGGGTIITTASSASLESGWGAAGYTIGKHAVLGIIRQAVAELGHLGIRSNAVAPGIVITPSISTAYGVPPEERDGFLEFMTGRLGDFNPSGKVAQPDDIAKVMLFLASDLASHVNGAIVTVDGGATVMARGDASADGVTTAFNEYQRQAPTSGAGGRS